LSDKSQIKSRQTLEHQPACSAVVPHSKIKMATFNLFNYLEPPNACYDFDRIYSQEQWLKKQQWIVDYLERVEPDVIGFQEVFSIKSLKTLTSKLGYEYFQVVDQPNVVDDFIYTQPVVAIASKYPITATKGLVVDKELALLIGIKENFSFNRKVLRATIELPHVGCSDFYVVHFKSKRSLHEYDEINALSNKTNAINKLKLQLLGNWGASIQRGSEAALLLHQIITRRVQVGFPAILLGDFNDELSNGAISHLIAENYQYKNFSDIDNLIRTYCLSDARELLINQSPDKAYTRQNTHYYGAKGSVLDYILLTNEFDARYQGSLFEVSEYEVYDRHLINPSYERDSQSSDHAVVSMTITLRS